MTLTLLRVTSPLENANLQCIGQEEQYNPNPFNHYRIFRYVINNKFWRTSQIYCHDIGRLRLGKEISRPRKNENIKIDDNKHIIKRD